MRLLLVEDNEELSALLVKCLEASGFEADTVATAADALSVLGSTHYAAAILDLGLPDGDGLAVLRTLRSDQNMIPVLIPLVVNSVIRSGELAEAMESRAYGAVKRPTSLVEYRARGVDKAAGLAAVALFSLAVYSFYFVLPAYLP